MVKINYTLSGLQFWLENYTSVIYNFLYFCSVFFCEFFHFKHVSRESGHMNFPKFSGTSWQIMVALWVILTKQTSLLQTLKCWHVWSTKKNNVPFLRYGVRQTDFFIIFDHFLPFTTPQGFQQVLKT